MDNHTSANDHVTEVEKYLHTELQYKALLGPFSEPPFPIHVSPLMTRPKSDSAKRRTIADFSWSKHCSVNAGVSKHMYLDTYFKLQYPSVDHITDALIHLGPGAMLYKFDISRAFRHLRIDPGDIDLLGLKHKDFFLDVTLPFGFHHGSTFFTRCSDAIRHIMRQHGFPGLWTYIDDLIYTGLPSKIHQSYTFLLHLLQQLGLDFSMEKLVSPTTSAICLGILVNTETRTISIPQTKLQDIKKLCLSWHNKKACTKNQLQSLLGSLLYITKCVRPAHFFLNRMLLLLRNNHNSTCMCLTTDFYKDLRWFNTFLQSHNGVTYYDTRKVTGTIYLEASLTAMGGVYQNMVYTLPIPANYNNYNINHLKMINIMVSLKIWGTLWSNRKININCNNLPVVDVLKIGRARDDILAASARNIWLLTSIFNIQLQVSHIQGSKNTTADLLSRCRGSAADIKKLNILLPDHVWIHTHQDLMIFNNDI